MRIHVICDIAQVNLIMSSKRRRLATSACPLMSLDGIWLAFCKRQRDGRFCIELWRSLVGDAPFLFSGHPIYIGKRRLREQASKRKGTRPHQLCRRGGHAPQEHRPLIARVLRVHHCTFPRRLSLGWSQKGRELPWDILILNSRAGHHCWFRKA